MRRMSRAIRLGFASALAVIASTGEVALALESATVAIVRDGQVAGEDPVPEIRAEVERLLSGRRTVIFKDVAAFDANWDPARYERVVQAAMDDPDVDFVVGLGAFVTRVAARPDFVLPKPFISGYVQRTPLLGVPFTSTGSEKENLTFIIVPRGVERDLAAFKQIERFETVYVLLGNETVPLIENMDEARALLKDELDVDFVLIGVGDDLMSAVALIPDDAKVVYLGRTPRLSRARRGELIDALNGRGLATFSLVGHADVRAGALAGMMPDLSQHVVRRIALNIAALMRGESAQDLPVVLTVDTRLMLNGATAAAIGLNPSFETLALAEVLDAGALEVGAQPLDFSGALSLAEARNIDLFVKDADVETTYRDKQLARSPLLPQIQADAGYRKSEPFLADAIFPKEFTNAGVSVSQMIFDDKAISDFRSSGRVYEANVLDREVTRLDVVANAGTEFLILVLNRLLLRVDADNVQLTADNLELSKVRYDVGYSGQDEVFRWTAELAGRRAQLLGSAARMEASLIGFNQALGVEQDRRWLPQEVVVDPQVFGWMRGKLDEIYRDGSMRPRLRQAIVQVAVDQAPELGFYQKALEAQDIQVGAATRSFFVPTLVFDFRYNYALNWEPAPLGARDDTYFWSLSAVYPIFNGAARYQDRKKQLAQKLAIENQRERTRQFVELRARTSFARVENSFPIIGLSQIAAENATKNLRVVQDKYAQGIVNVTDLLEAQNQAFSSQQNAAAAVYEFLIDVVELQRSLSWFEAEYSEAEVDDMVQRIRDIITGLN